MRTILGWVPVGLAVAVLAAAGCASHPDDAYFRNTSTAANVYVAPGAPAVHKVALLPFKGPTSLAGESVADLWVTEVLRAGRYELVERSRLAQVLGETELALAGLSAARAAEAGAMAGADAVLIGTVDEYGTVAYKGRTLPVVGVTARLVECRTGRVVWSVDHARKGGPGDTLPGVARQVVHEMMAALYKAW